MSRKRLLFVGDGGSPEELIALLGDVEIVFDLRSIPVRISPARRHLIYLGMALKTVLRNRRYDKIFFHQQYIAVYYSIMSRLAAARTPFLVFYIIGKKGSGVAGRVKTGAFMALLRDRNNLVTYFMTTADYLYRALQGSPLSGKCKVQNDLDVDTRLLDAIVDHDAVGTTIFSGGTNNREYADIAALARANPATDFRIACRAEDVRHIDLPANVVVRTDAYGEAFDRLIAECRLVVIPVRDPDVMSGQLVCIQALAAGKVVLFRANNFLKDWLGGIDRLPFIRQYRDADELRAIVAGLGREDLHRLGGEARRFYRDEISGRLRYQAFAQDIAATAWR